MQKTLQRPEMRGVAVALSAVLIFGAMLIAGPSLARADTSISVVDNSFSPQTITIAPGDTVTWTNNGTMQHTVTADDGSYDSGTLNPGASFSHTFADAGTFPYHCTFHGAAGGVGMSGTVVVDASLSSASSTSSSTSTNSTTSTSTTTSTGTTTSATTTSSAPVLSNGNVVPNDTGATVTWTTDVSSDAQVSYGETTAYTTTTASDGMSATNHSVTVSGLMPRTLYHFQAMSSANGVMGMSPDETFTTTNSASSTSTGTSTATSTPIGTGTTTGTTTTPADASTLSGQISQLEADIKSLQAEIDAILQGTSVPPPLTMGPMTSTLGTAVYADTYSVGSGAAVQFRGSGFGPNENVLITVNGAVVGSAHADANGAFTVNGNASGTAGDTTYWFTGQNSGNSDSVMITVETGSSA